MTSCNKTSKTLRHFDIRKRKKIVTNATREISVCEINSSFMRILRSSVHVQSECIIEKQRISQKMDIEIRVTQLVAPIKRYRSEGLPQLVFEGQEQRIDGQSFSDDSLLDCKNVNGSSERRYSLPDVTSSLPDMTSSSIPEVTYGMRPRMAWLCRYDCKM